MELGFCLPAVPGCAIDCGRTQGGGSDRRTAATEGYRAILAADVAGYSRLMGLDEEGTVEQLKNYRAEFVRSEDYPDIVAGSSGPPATECWPNSPARSMPARCAVDHPAFHGQAPISMSRRTSGLNCASAFTSVTSSRTMATSSATASTSRPAWKASPSPAASACRLRLQEDVEGRLDVVFKDGGEQHLKNIARPVRIYNIQFGQAGSSKDVSSPMLALPGKPSVVVLPFQNMSGDPEQDYFADGMAEDIITALSRFPLPVRDRPQFQLHLQGARGRREADRPRTRRALCTRRQRAQIGPRMRVTGQLIDASTDTHLWADNFDGAQRGHFRHLQDKSDGERRRRADTVDAAICRDRTCQAPADESPIAHMTHMRGVASLYLWTKAGVDEALRLAYEADQARSRLQHGLRAGGGLLRGAQIHRLDHGSFAREMAEVEALDKTRGRGWP